jgi:anaphase-promoting complex subunit 1
MSSKSRYFHLQLQDLRFTADFYSKVYDRRFSGRVENTPRPPLIRDTTVLGALHALDQRLDVVRTHPKFVDFLGSYARGDTLPETIIREDGIDKELESLDGEVLNRYLAWYLLRNGVPVSTLLVLGSLTWTGKGCTCTMSWGASA